MRLAKPEIVRGFPYPGLSVDEINLATGQTWTDEKLQRGVTYDKNKELDKRFREENRSAIADLRDDYAEQSSNIRLSMRGREQRHALSNLSRRHNQNIRHMKERWMEARAQSIRG